MSRDEEKYSVVEDAAPQSTNQLEKGLYVLYKCSLALTSTSGHCGQSGGGASLSLSHSSTPTPTTPTSPDHSNLSYPSSSGGGGGSGGSGGSGEGSVAVRFRLGKIVEYKEKLKSFLIQPVCLSTISGVVVGGGVMNGGSGGSGDVITSSDLISAEWVKRPNLRLITPPWYAEFKNELGLKPGRDVHINMLVHTQPPQQPLLHLLPTPLISIPALNLAYIQRGQHLAKVHSIIQNGEAANRILTSSKLITNNS